MKPRFSGSGMSLRSAWVLAAVVAASTALIGTAGATQSPKAQVKGNPGGVVTPQATTQHDANSVRPKVGSIGPENRPAPPAGEMSGSPQHWWDGAPKFIYDKQVYYFNSDFKIYFGGLALTTTVSKQAPAGTAYLDPFSHQTFPGLAAYRNFMKGRNHPLLLLMVKETASGR